MTTIKTHTSVPMPDNACSPAEGQSGAGAGVDDFFVGYLPVPSVLKRFYQRVTIGLTVLIAAAAALIAGMQNDPGNATWDLDNPQTFEGLLLAEPYPMLRVAGEREGDSAGTVLLVGEGKASARERAEPFDGQLVRIRGTPLQRDGRRMIELDSASDAITGTGREGAAADVLPPAPAALSAVALRGQVIDPKCFLGAMKPGEGKTHKACAALCLRGGIPPMFVSWDAGEPRYYLLVNAHGQALVGEELEALVAVVGDPVTVTGQVQAWGDLVLLRVSPKDVMRD